MLFPYWFQETTKTSFGEVFNQFWRRFLWARQWNVKLERTTCSIELSHWPALKGETVFSTWDFNFLALSAVHLLNLAWSVTPNCEQYPSTKKSDCSDLVTTRPSFLQAFQPSLILVHTKTYPVPKYTLDMLVGQLAPYWKVYYPTVRVPLKRASPWNPSISGNVRRTGGFLCFLDFSRSF